MPSWEGVLSIIELVRVSVSSRRLNLEVYDVSMIGRPREIILLAASQCVCMCVLNKPLAQHRGFGRWRVEVKPPVSLGYTSKGLANRDVFHQFVYVLWLDDLRLNQVERHFMNRDVLVLLR